jgi:parvulin-like peptidyl-prolyl isomerase
MIRRHALVEPDFFDVRKASVRRSMSLLAAGAVIGLVLAGYGLFTAKGTRSRRVPPEAVALVNQRPILRSDFMTQTQTQFFLPFAQVPYADRQKVLRDMIDEELMMQRGLEIDLPSYDPGVRSALVAGVELEVTADVLALQPTPEEMRSYYEAHKAKYSSEGLMQLRDLVVKSGPARPAEQLQGAAEAAGAALRKHVPVEAVIKTFGLVDSGRFMDAGHVDTGNIFQFAVKDKTDPVSYQAAIRLKDGEVSEPIPLADGIHLLVMLSHRFPVPESFEEAQDRVWADIKTEAQTKVRAANLIYLRNRADVMIAPEYRQ